MNCDTSRTAPPAAPKGLPSTDRKLWRRIVCSFPGDWFRASDFPLLIEMVRALAMSDTLSEKIAKCDDTAKLKTLLALRDRECRRAAGLATKLRLPPQSRSDRHLAGARTNQFTYNERRKQNAFSQFCA